MDFGSLQFDLSLRPSVCLSVCEVRVRPSLPCSVAPVAASVCMYVWLLCVPVYLNKAMSTRWVNVTAVKT